MNFLLKAFLLGFGIGAFTGFIFGAPIGLLLSLFGINPLQSVAIIVVVSGFLVGIPVIILALVWYAIPPKMRILVAVGILVLGLVTIQPEIDAVAVAGLALTYMVDDDDDGSDYLG